MKMMADYRYEEIKYLRDRLKSLDSLRFQMILVCAAGYTTILGLSKVLPPLAIPLMLFTLLMITENIHYNALKESLFIGRLIIYCSKYFKGQVNFEKIYGEVYSNPTIENKGHMLKILIERAKDTVRLFSYPFFILPLAFVFTSIYFIKPTLSSKSFFSYEWSIAAFIIFMYLWILVREINLRRKTITSQTFKDLSKGIARYYKKST